MGLVAEKMITLKCFDAKEPSNTNGDRRSYGNNRYSQSNIDQWLNSQAASWVALAPRGAGKVGPQGSFGHAVFVGQADFGIRQKDIDQWLNSQAASWYSARHSYDAPPSNANVWSNYNEYDTEAGFLSNFEADVILP